MPAKRNKTVPISIALEVDTPKQIHIVLTPQFVSISLAVETDIALPITLNQFTVHYLGYGSVSETDTALPIAVHTS